MTRQKLAVLHAIEHSGRSLHPTEIQSIARHSVPSLNLSTVYRVLKTLVEEQRVAKVALPGQPMRFEATTALPGVPSDTLPEHHHHFHCLQCEQVFPIHGCPGHIERFAPQGFDVASHDLTLHGHCARCKIGTTPTTAPSA